MTCPSIMEVWRQCISQHAVHGNSISQSACYVGIRGHLQFVSLTGKVQNICCSCFVSHANRKLAPYSHRMRFWNAGAPLGNTPIGNTNEYHAGKSCCIGKLSSKSSQFLYMKVLSIPCLQILTICEQPEAASLRWKTGAL